MKYITVNVTLDAFSAIFLFILMMYLLVSAERKSKLSRSFSLTCLANIAMLVGDIPTWLYLGVTTTWHPMAMWLGCLVQYAGGVATPLTYTLYVINYLSPKTKLSRKPLIIIGILGVIGAVFVIVNLWNGMYYTIDSQNFYHRGDWWIVSQIIAVSILFIDAGIVVRYRHLMRRKDLWSFLGYNLLPMAAILVQSTFYGLALTYTATTFAILIIFLNIQSEQAMLLEQNKKELTESKISIMLSQIQPHFLYNALTSIKGLCVSDPKRAEKAVDSFSIFLRGNMNSLSSRELIPFSQELTHCKTYLELEQLRFGERVQVAYELDATDFLLPTLTLQPIVENAVRHGVTKRREGGTIWIRTEETDSSWRITVADNGVGCDLPKKRFDGCNHTGVQNVWIRLKEQCGGTLYIDSVPGQGTVAVINIPKEGKPI